MKIMSIVQKDIDKHGGILLYATAKRIASLFCGKCDSHRNTDAKSIVDKREILGGVIGKTSGKERPDGDVTRHPARYEIGSLRPKHSVCIPCLLLIVFVAGV